MKRRRPNRKKNWAKSRTYSLEEKERYAARLRKNLTQAEQVVWDSLKLRQEGLKVNFQPQRVVAGYIPDFVCMRSMVIVEIDGSVHKYQKKRDAMRQRHLEWAGYRVLRFTNSQALGQTYWVVTRILSECG